MLKENEARFRFIADSTCDWESWIGLDGKLMWVNPAVENITGYSREEYLNMPHRLKHIIFDDDQERILSHFENGIKHHKSANDVDFRIRCKDGSLKWVSVSYQPMYMDGGECLGLRSSIRDIHKRKKIEEQLLTANVFLDALMENLPVAVFVKETKELKYVYWNTACESQIGVLKHDIIGKTDYDVFSREIADRLTAMDRLTAETGELLNIPEELVNVPFKGTSFFHTKKVPLLNQQGLPAFILGIAENITEQKQTQSALRESEEKYRTLLNDATDAIFLADQEGNIFESNKQAEKLLGYTAQELTGINFAQLHIEQERDSVVNLVKTTLLPQGTWSLPAVQLKKKDGTPVPVDITGSFVEYAGQRVIQGVVRDISERKAAEAQLAAYRRYLEDMVKVRTAELTALNAQLQQEIEGRKITENKLRRSEEQFRSVIETASDAIVTADSSGNIILWNKAAEKTFGYTAEEMLHKPFLGIMPEQLREEHWRQFTSFLEEREPGIVVTHGQLQARRKDGSELSVEGSASLWKTNDGVFLTSLIRDISDRKQSEELLQKSEDRFRNLAQSSTEAIIIIDSEGAIIFWNKSAERMYGYTQEEVLHKNNSMLVPARLQSQSERYFEQLRRDPTVAAPDHLYESCARRKDGSEFPVEVALSLWSTGDSTFYCVMLRDITERKRSDYVIRKVNECLLSFSADPDKNIQGIVETAGMIFDGAAASYFKKQADAAHIAMAWHLPARYRNLPPFNAHNFDKLFASGADQPLILNRRNILRSVTKDSPMLQMGFESFIATPVKLRNTFIGSLNVAFNDEKRFSPSELDIFSILAKAVSIEEERKRVLEELKQNQLMLIKSKKKPQSIFRGRYYQSARRRKKISPARCTMSSGPWWLPSAPASRSPGKRLSKAASSRR